MENIKSTASSPRIPELQSSPAARKDVKTKQSEFIEKFEKIKLDDVRTRLEGVFEKILHKADSLKDTLSLKNVMEYKKLVKEFMQIASENSHAFTKQSFLDRRGRHRMHSIIKQVDRELDSITKEFIKSPIEHAKVLNSIDAIRGLLIDIMA